MHPKSRLNWVKEMRFKTVTSYPMNDQSSLYENWATCNSQWPSCQNPSSWKRISSFSKDNLALLETTVPSSCVSSSFVASHSTCLSPARNELTRVASWKTTHVANLRSSFAASFARLPSPFAVLMFLNDGEEFDRRFWEQGCRSCAVYAQLNRPRNII
jgi:hypothetical protein